PMLRRCVSTSITYGERNEGQTAFSGRQLDRFPTARFQNPRPTSWTQRASSAGRSSKKNHKIRPLVEVVIDELKKIK
ncbi:MAG TPA: hypothetical protein VFF31_05485, partial [Blastocatellia bacterium]|nr:hypothetical protein [Blastocatellia bacterium]